MIELLLEIYLQTILIEPQSLVCYIQMLLFHRKFPITTNVVSSNPVRVEAYSIQHYVIKFVGDLRQVSGFLRASDSNQ